LVPLNTYTRLPSRDAAMSSTVDAIGMVSTAYVERSITFTTCDAVPNEIAT
jgi:hypothetical protein